MLASAVRRAWYRGDRAAAARQVDDALRNIPPGSIDGVDRPFRDLVDAQLIVGRVDAAKAMVDMIGSMRTFQSGQQAIQAIDQTLQAASTQVGTLSGNP